VDSIHPDNIGASPLEKPHSHDPQLGSQRIPHDGNVAVIAIHGVGRHLPGASAGAVSTLLMSIGRNTGASETEKRRGTNENAPPYSGFATMPIDIPLRPTQAPEGEAEIANYRDKGSWLFRVWHLFDERRGYLARARKEADFVPSGYSREELRTGEPDRGEFAYQFMLTQVAGYQGEVDRNFQTVRLEGQRAAKSSATHVHIYDAHYSDLTKPQNNILSFFFAFYQLLFHLASLSLQAVYWVEAENVRTENVKKDRTGTRRWRVGSSIHATSVRFLTMWIPFLNLILLEIAASAFVEKARDWAGLPGLALGFTALIGLGGTFWQFWQKGSPSRPFLWSTIPFLGAGAGLLVLSAFAYVYNSIFHLRIQFSEMLLLLGWLLAAGLIHGWIAWKYNPLRPGALPLAIALYLANLLWFLFYLLPHAASAQHVGQNQIATASFWAVQWIFAELVVAWTVCLLCALLSWPLSAFCKHAIDRADQRGKDRFARATAAFRTGRFAFAVPAVLFLIATCALWSGLVVYGSDKLNAFEGVSAEVAASGLSSSKPVTFLIPSISAIGQYIERVRSSHNPPNCKPPNRATCEQTDFPSTYLRGLLLVSVTPGLPVTMALFAISLLLLTWAVLPSVVFEVKPEWTENAAANRMVRLGEWLSRGLDNTAILTRLLWAAIVPIPLAFFVFDWLVLHGNCRFQNAVDYASGFTLPLIEKQGLLLAVSGAAVFGFFLKYLTTVLDTVLDVDNYLRTSPKDETPRARIAERITSLLRYIAAHVDDRGRPYSKVVIVAHSLGSMVTTDLLRYLERSAKHSPDPGLSAYDFRKMRISGEAPKLPIYVFSMGSPLRQLLNRFFPHLYWWVSDVPSNSVESLGNALAPPPTIRSPLPRRDEMNVTFWCNAYRSGDYVGRSLWLGEWLDRNASGDITKPLDPTQAPADLPCDEICIGLGAHTHYWDRSAPDIAAQLDRLLA
jgi:hypothetical protein